MERVSVIIPVYNMEKTVGRAIDSALNQTYSNIEVVLINDGSIDGSGAICEEYAGVKDNIVYISRENRGVSLTYKEGVSVASGEFVIFLDSDDYIDPEMVSSLISVQKECHADIVQSGIRYVTENGKVVKEFVVANKIIEEKKELWQKYFISQEINRTFAGNLYRKCLFDNAEFNPTARNMDLLVGPYLLAQSNLFCGVDKQYYNAVLYKNSVSRGNITDRMYADKHNLINNWNDFINQHASELVDYMYYLRTSMSMGLYLKLTSGSAQTSETDVKIAESKKMFLDNYLYFKSSKVKDWLPLKERVKISMFKLSPKLFVRVTKLYEKYISA